MNENLQHAWDKIKEVYGRMELRQRLMIAILLAVTFGAIIWLISLTGRTDYGLLFARLDPENTQRTINLLKDMDIKYKLLSRDGGANNDIMIPAELVGITRINLAAEKIGQNVEGVGYELFDRTTLGRTEFVQKSVDYKRAQEGELQRTIQAIDGINYARVHLVFPEERIFREDQRQPSASVMLRTDNRPLTEKRIEGIVNLISGAIEGLDPLNITVVDHTGRLLSKNEEDGFAEIADKQMKLQIQRENRLISMVQTYLDNTFGPGNSDVAVNVELDFDQVEVTNERFDPEASVVRSEEIETHNTTSLRDSTSVVNERQITNYEISTTTQRRVSAVGTIKRLSANVTVNHRRTARMENNKQIIEYVERTQDEIAAIHSSVSAIVGANEERGDQVVVNSRLFERDDDIILLAQEREARFNRYMDLAERGAIVVVLIVLIFVLLSQFRKIFAQPEPEEEEEEEEADEVIEDGSVLPAALEGAGAEGFYPEGDEGMPMGEGKIAMTFKPIKDIELEQTESMLFIEAIQKFVVENPEITVKLIKSWMMDRLPPGRAAK